ncbi:two pore domain potassium channel family protein [Clostridiales Family XIII bacterium RF-744-FAT-WT-3]|uniref:Two pore domain potassium channel family protein n=1 Tax=Baileyella intestinalis TaxID=2606709 RepID=A0A6A8M9I5_9FIRM|nr:potassium channel family protein [Baileyella intestinalis]MST68057.1 two pore domain potassium channel family protein [Baileyella intestinalis]
MKQIRMIRNIYSRTHADRILRVYLIFFFISALIITASEPAIKTFGEGVWYSFVSVMTIGFGDYVAVTFIGRLMTILLSIYSMLVFAILTGVITSFFMDAAKMRYRDSMEEFMDDLMHLEELPPERLAEMSEKAKKFNKNRQ